MFRSHSVSGARPKTSPSHPSMFREAKKLQKKRPYNHTHSQSEQALVVPNLLEETTPSDESIARGPTVAYSIERTVTPRMRGREKRDEKTGNIGLTARPWSPDGTDGDDSKRKLDATESKGARRALGASLIAREAKALLSREAKLLPKAIKRVEDVVENAAVVDFVVKGTFAALDFAADALGSL